MSNVCKEIVKTKDQKQTTQHPIRLFLGSDEDLFAFFRKIESHRLDYFCTLGMKVPFR